MESRQRCLNNKCLYSKYDIHLCGCVCRGFFHGLGYTVLKRHWGVFSHIEHSKKKEKPEILRMIALTDYASNHDIKSVTMKR